jgi:solute carrier family 8 (sodium/calcium exchanger)
MHLLMKMTKTQNARGFISDTFASKVAACQDKYADASVGNVTGSNAVNVFLGIGVGWSIAAIYRSCHSEPFLVEPGK